MKPSKPLISILLAVRNEEGCVLDCLNSLTQQDYPYLEILIGDDGSTDKTQHLVRDFIQDKPQCSLFNTCTVDGMAEGKAQVLAYLAQKAQGSLFLFTDADIIHPNAWVSEMYRQWREGLGVVIGTTKIHSEATGVFAKMQSLDLIQGFSQVKMLGKWDIPVSAMGNNLMVARKAYEAVGGYESLPFSLTEDFQLFHAIVKKGFGFAHCFHAKGLVETKPEQNLSDWLNQRKRWMTGAVQLPWWMVGLLLMQSLWYPLLILLAISVSWPVALTAWGVSALIKGLFLNRELRELDSHSLGISLPLFEIFGGVMPVLALGYYLFPVSVRWKGRTKS